MISTRESEVKHFAKGKHWMTPTQVFDGFNLLSDHSILVVDGTIKDLKATDGLPTSVRPRKFNGIISPGYLDIQVNGGGGVLFNTSPTAAGALAIADAHHAFGTAAILPTVITDDPKTMVKAVDAVIACWGDEKIAGIHIEGPHISHARNGTHDTRFIRPLDQTTFECVERLRASAIPTILTLAPEAVTRGQIKMLCDLGVVVSIGHSDATATEVQNGLNEGVSLFTHLFNGMSQMQNREPGVVGAAINSSAYCSIICDGIHVAGDMIKLAHRARPLPDRMIIVSDAMPTVGGPNSFDLYGQTISVVNDSLVNAQGSLAGAHTTMHASVLYLIQKLGFTIEEALRMATTNPAELLGLKNYHTLIDTNLKDCAFLPADV